MCSHHGARFGPLATGHDVRMGLDAATRRGRADDAGADERVVVIKVRDNGPYKVTGPVEIVDAEGNRFAVDADRPIALCRCGRSQTKPFCDASHKAAGFDACERADRL
jgi:CDGSH-type Zn-finger protein